MASDPYTPLLGPPPIPETEKRALVDLGKILQGPVVLYDHDFNAMWTHYPNEHELKNDSKSKFFYSQRFGDTPQFFGGLGTVRNNHVDTLILCHGNLTTLPSSMANFTHLWKLSLIHNDFITFPEVLTKLPALQELYLSHNKFTELPDTVNRMTNLRGILLVSNKLTRLPDPFGPFPKLEWLMLGFNLLEQFPEWSAPFPEHYITIDLTSNRLSDLPKSLANFHIQNLDLSQNKFTTLPSVIKNLNTDGLNFNNNPLQPPYDYINNRRMRTKPPHLKNVWYYINNKRTRTKPPYLKDEVGILKEAVYIAYMQHMIAYWEAFPDNLLTLLRANRLPGHQFHQLILHSTAGGFVLQKCAEIATPAARQYAAMISEEYHCTPFKDYTLYGPI